MAKKMNSDEIGFVIVGYSEDLHYQLRGSWYINDRDVDKIKHVLVEENEMIKRYRLIKRMDVYNRCITINKLCGNCKGRNMTSDEACNSCMKSLAFQMFSEIKRTPGHIENPSKLYDLRRNRNNMVNILALLGGLNQHRLPYELIRTLKAYLY